MLVDGQDAEGQGSELDVPVIELSFDYAGTRIRASDRREGFFVSSPAGLVSVKRNRQLEQRAQCLLEGFGAVELGCLETHTPPYDSQADYVVQVDPSAHALCSFTACAVPHLRDLGWDIRIDPNYPYQVVDAEPSWHVGVEPLLGKNDWFNLELGVEVEGQRINLVKALLSLLDECPKGSSLQSLARMPARLRAVPVAKNRYITLPSEQLTGLVEVLLELYRGERVASAIAFPACQAPALWKLFRGFAERRRQLAFEAAEATKLRLEAPPARDRVPVSSVTRTLRANLRPYQEQGLAWLQQLAKREFGGILADDMGLGKTLQAIAHLVLEKNAGRLDLPALVVMPTSLTGNWQREMAKFAPFLSVAVLTGPKRRALRQAAERVDVVITTYPIVLRDIDYFQRQAFSLVVLDEAQTIKNPGSQVFGAVKQLRARQRICLTGTPIENSLRELWALFDFLMPDLLGSARQFQTQFVVPIEQDAHPDPLNVLRARIRPFVLRRMKEEVARELPAKTEMVRPVEILGDQRELYERIRVAAHADVRQLIKKRGLERSTVAVLDALLKLRQVCCDPRLVNVEAAREVRGSAKLRALMGLLDSQLGEGRRVLVFSQFTRMLALIAESLAKRDISYRTLTGSTPDRQRVVDQFEGGAASVFLISLKAGGTGLNLTRAETVIHYDPWWNPAAQSQATDRAHRIGQTRAVFVHSLIVAGSVEERMLQLQRRKRHLAESILSEHARMKTRLSEEEIDDLFAPLS